jgi:hypothetical protein
MFQGGFDMLKALGILSLFVGQLKNQMEKWPKYISWSIRFLCCGITSFFAFSLLKPLGDAVSGKENEIIIAAFENPEYWVVIVFSIIFGYMGLGFSVVSVALFNSLLPKT